MNPYQILGITPSTSYEDAKRIFRKRMKELHPDMGGDPKEMQKLGTTLILRRIPY